MNVSWNLEHTIVQIILKVNVGQMNNKQKERKKQTKKQRTIERKKQIKEQRNTERERKKQTKEDRRKRNFFIIISD